MTSERFPPLAWSTGDRFATVANRSRKIEARADRADGVSRITRTDSVVGNGEMIRAGGVWEVA